MMNPDRIERQINIRQDGEGNTQFNIFDSPSPPKYKPRFGLPYPPSMNFVEPEGALERLHDRLQIGSCVIAAVAGMVGVGKTELALQYAAKYGETYEGGCYWLGLRDRNLADELAQHIKTEFQQEVPPEILEKGKRARWCWQFWERHLPENTSVLTVLDNVDEAQQIGGMLPGSPRFRLLVTTRQQCLDAAFAEEVLAELTNPKALELLKNSWAIGSGENWRRQNGFAMKF